MDISFFSRAWQQIIRTGISYLLSLLKTGTWCTQELPSDGISTHGSYEWAVDNQLWPKSCRLMEFLLTAAMNPLIN
jgi:hypothetical protein